MAVDRCSQHELQTRWSVPEHSSTCCLFPPSTIRGPIKYKREWRTPEQTTFWVWGVRRFPGVRRCLWARCCYCWVTSVVSDSVQPHRHQHTRLLHSWDFPGKSTGVGYHGPLQWARWERCKKEKLSYNMNNILEDFIEKLSQKTSRQGRSGISLLEWVF